MSTITVQDILNRVEVADQEKCYFWDLTDVFSDLNLDIQDFKEGSFNTTFVDFDIWMDVDTVVGIRVFLYESKPLCIEFKPHRKATPKYIWISKERTDSYIDHIHHYREYDFSYTCIGDSDDNSQELLDKTLAAKR